MKELIKVLTDGLKSDLLPDLVRDTAMYGMWSNGVGVVIGLALFVGVFFVFKWFFKHYDDGMDRSMFSMVAVFVLLPNLMFVLACVNSFVMALFTPKVYALKVITGSML